MREPVLYINFYRPLSPSSLHMTLTLSLTVFYSNHGGIFIWTKLVRFPFLGAKRFYKYMALVFSLSQKIHDMIIHTHIII